jgi:hypothetical protein
MAAMQGQPAPKPSSLGAPVPGSDAEREAQEFLAQFEAPQMNAAAAQETQAAGPDDEASAQELLAQTAQEQSEFNAQEPSSFMGVGTDIPQQIKDIPVRIAANLAGDPESVKMTLRKRLGDENVRERDGEIFFKNPGDKAFRKLDPTTFEVVNDLFSDFYKEYIQAMGGAAGAVKGAALGPAGVVGGAALGVAGATAAVGAAEGAMGVVRPGQEDQSVGAQTQRGLEKTGEYLAEGAMFAMTEGIFKGIAQKWAARRAKVDGLKKLEEVAPIDRLQESVKGNLETLNEMKNLGLTRKIEGTNIEIPANQLLPFLPEVERAAGTVAGEKAFIQAQKEAAENFSNASLSLVEAAADLTEGQLKKSIRAGLPSDKVIAASDINNLFNSVRKAEGAVIGEFRDKARAVAKKSPMPSPNTAEVVQGIFRDVGVKSQNGKLIFPPDDQFAQLLGTDSKLFINGIKTDLRRLNDRLVKGGMTIDELLAESQIMGAKNEGARRIGGVYKTAIGRLSSAIRKDSREAMPNVLEPDDAKLYLEKMQRFGKISESMEQLDTYLRDDIGLNTFAKGLVNKGREGLANLKAAKEFLLQEDPDMYKAVIGEFMEELAVKTRDPKAIGGFNPAAMRKQLQALGPEYLNELFPKRGPINKELVLKSFDLADQLQRTIKGGSDDQLKKDAQKAIGALSIYHRGVNATYALLNLGSKDARLLKMLSREGIESFLAQTPKKSRPQMRETLNGILSLARQNGTLGAINPQINMNQGGPAEQ